MRILNDDLANELVSQPESGMGYQIVDMDFGNYGTKRRLILNAEFVLDEEEAQQELDKSKFDSLLRDSLNTVVLSRSNVRSLHVVNGREFGVFFKALRESPTEYAADRGAAIDAAVERTSLGEVFKRFSAFSNDRRVLRNKRFASGTFATTESDSKNIKTGMDAVARYALPNLLPAIYVFTATPLPGTDLKRGTVAYMDIDRPGGGIEVLFPNGTTLNTVTGPVIIPSM